MTGLRDEAPNQGEMTHFRSKAGRTKRERSRAALLAAAARLFGTRGWQATHLEDIAQEAGVVVTTIYAHFPSKQALLACVYASRMQPLFDHAQDDLGQGRHAVEALQRHVRELVAIARDYQALTIAFLEAAMEARLRNGHQPAGEDDSCQIVPLTTLLAQLVTAGQQRGELRPYPQAEDVGVFITQAALLRVLTHPEESAEDTSALVLALFLRTLELDQA